MAAKNVELAEGQHDPHQQARPGRTRRNKSIHGDKQEKCYGIQEI